MKGFKIYSVRSYQGHTVKLGIAGQVHGVFINDKLIMSTNDTKLAFDKSFEYFLWIVKHC